jgi:hypothetical protein
VLGLGGATKLNAPARNSRTSLRASRLSVFDSVAGADGTNDAATTSQATPSRVSSLSRS